MFHTVADAEEESEQGKSRIVPYIASLPLQFPWLRSWESFDSEAAPLF